MANLEITSEMAIETRGLTRTYESYRKPEGLINSVRGFWHREYDSKTALSPTSLTVEGGQIVGLVGANGAGKTTLLKLLSGLIHPSSGEARVLGYRPSDRQPQLLRQISILLGQKNQLWWDIPAADSYRLLTDIYGLDPKESRDRVTELAELLNCRSLLQVQLRRLSLGERMKMEIIGSLLHRPKVIFLDEPTLGLDILAQTAIREFLVRYVERERPTILLTSHYMDDISKLADRLLLISRGAIVYDGTVQDFMNTAEPVQTLQVRLSQPLSADLELEGEMRIPAGADHFRAEMPAKRMAFVIQKIMTSTTVDELKIEETDFEDVIRTFLNKEHRNHLAEAGTSVWPSGAPR